MVCWENRKILADQYVVYLNSFRRISLWFWNPGLLDEHTDYSELLHITTSTGCEMSHLWPNIANGFSFSRGSRAEMTSSTICCMLSKNGSLARLSRPGSFTANTGAKRINGAPLLSSQRKQTFKIKLRTGKKQWCYTSANRGANATFSTLEFLLTLKTF